MGGAGLYRLSIETPPAIPLKGLGRRGYEKDRDRHALSSPPPARRPPPTATRTPMRRSSPAKTARFLGTKPPGPPLPAGGFTLSTALGPPRPIRGARGPHPSRLPRAVTSPRPLTRCKRRLTSGTALLPPFNWEAAFGLATAVTAVLLSNTSSGLATRTAGCRRCPLCHVRQVAFYRPLA